MQPPCRRLAPGAGTARPPPLGRQGAARGDHRPPTPPPPLPQAQERTEADQRDGGPAPPRRGRCTWGAGASRSRQAPARPACCRPTAGQQRPGQRKRSSPFRGRPGEDGGANQGGGVPPPPPPPRRTDPLAADWAAPDARGHPATPTAQVYPGGARRRQQMAGRRPTGRGDGGWWGGPPNPPPAPPPRLRATGATLRPPGAKGRPPLPQKGPRRGGGGGCGWTCTLRAPAPPAACSRGGRDRRASSPQRTGAARRPSLGAAHGGAPVQYGGRAPHDPPQKKAHTGRAEGGFRSGGAPDGAFHGPPFIPPHPGAATRPRPHAHAEGECANDK